MRIVWPNPNLLWSRIQIRVGTSYCSVREKGYPPYLGIQEIQWGFDQPGAVHDRGWDLQQVLDPSPDPTYLPPIFPCSKMPLPFVPAKQGSHWPLKVHALASLLSQWCKSSL